MVMRTLLSRVLLSTTLLFTAPAVKSQSWYLSPGAVSYHSDREAGYNERNYGLGVTYVKDTTNAYAAGFYENSIRNNSYYAAWRYTPVDLSFARFGAMLGVVSGYKALDGNPIPFILPAAVTNWGPVEFLFTAWPSLGSNTGGGVAMQFSLKVW